MSALLLIAAREGGGDGKGGDEGVFEKVIIRQLKNLRRQLGNE